MLRKFRVKLNGKEYIVEMEEIGAPVVAQPVQPVVSEQPVPQQAPSVSPQQNLSVEGGTEVVSPMPGNILDIMVKVGDTVAENQKLLVLEAMKMENSIVSPKSGTVVAINVSKGENIDVGHVMVVVK